MVYSCYEILHNRKNTEAECHALIWNASKDRVLNNKKKTRSLYVFYTLTIKNILKGIRSVLRQCIHTCLYIQRIHLEGHTDGDTDTLGEED